MRRALIAAVLSAILSVAAFAETVTGIGSTSSQVKLFVDRTFQPGTSFLAFAGFTGGVRVASGDIDGDGVDEIVVGSGPGAAVVSIFDSRTLAVRRSFDAYPGYTGGIFVAAGDVNGDGLADIITGANDTAPHVKVFDGGSNALLQSFFAFAGGFTGGVRVAAGDLNGDGRADIIVGAGPGSSAVKVFHGQTLAVLASFFAYSGYTGGIFVGAGDFNGDGLVDIITGTETGNAHVKVFDGQTNATLRSFFAFPGFTGGVRVAGGDVNGDGVDDIIAGTGPGAAMVEMYDGPTNARINGYDAYVGSVDGVYVGHLVPHLPAVTSLFSRKVHRSSGTFDLALPMSGTPGVECRSGGADNSHQLVFTFTEAVTVRSASLTAGHGAVAGVSGNGTATISLDLTGVSNAQTITVNLADVNNGSGQTDIAARMGVLLGDTTRNGSVNASDAGLTKSVSGQAVSSTNFASDVTVSGGSINASDVGAIKAQSGTSLP